MESQGHLEKGIWKEIHVVVEVFLQSRSLVTTQSISKNPPLSNSPSLRLLFSLLSFQSHFLMSQRFLSPARPSIHPSIHPLIHPFICTSIHPSIHPSVIAHSPQHLATKISCSFPAVSRRPMAGSDSNPATPSSPSGHALHYLEDNRKDFHLRVKCQYAGWQISGELESSL